MEFLFLFIPIGIAVIVLLANYLYKVKVIIPYKNQVVKKALLEMDSQILYQYEVKESYFKGPSDAYDLFPRARNFRETDLIIDKNITSVDLEASHVVSSGKSSRKVIDFKGRIYDVVLESKVDCDFILKEEILNRAPCGFTLLDVELTVFNKKFNLYVSNPEKAFHIFTPVVIQKIVQLEEKAAGNLTLAYVDKHLIFGENDKEDWFENLTTSAEVKEEYLRQKTKILEFIELFSNK